MAKSKKDSLKSIANKFNSFSDTKAKLQQKQAELEARRKREQEELDKKMAAEEAKANALLLDTIAFTKFLEKYPNDFKLLAGFIIAGRGQVEKHGQEAYDWYIKRYDHYLETNGDLYPPEDADGEEEEAEAPADDGGTESSVGGDSGEDEEEEQYGA